MADLKPISVYMFIGGPNPYKVLILLEELGVPYKIVLVNNPKEEWFLKINPNGRVPAIEDPNTEITLWESGAIVEYLVETYDKENTLTFTEPALKWKVKQYLHFQMSGQGPYYGQGVWFQKCPEDIPTAKKRYLEQIVRVMEVLDGILKDKEYLVGGKLTYADLVFFPWDNIALNASFFGGVIRDGYKIEKKYPHFTAWHNRLRDRPSVKKAYEAK